MANVTSRTELIQYCYRALGSPLVTIDMTDEQADDIVDTAIEYFREYYFDAIERVYYKYQITQTDFDNRYLTLPDNIWGVTKVYPQVGTGNNSASYIFDAQYQLRMSDFNNLIGTSMQYFTQMQGHLALLDYLLNTQKQFRFNRLTNKLYIDQDWTAKDPVGDYLLMECYSVIDPDVNTKFWNERLFKRYVTALFKKQWGQNISKYKGITLPGGVTLDGAGMHAEGKEEAEAIENDIMGKLAPLEFTMG